SKTAAANGAHRIQDALLLLPLGTTYQGTCTQYWSWEGANVLHIYSCAPVRIRKREDGEMAKAKHATPPLLKRRGLRWVPPPFQRASGLLKLPRWLIWNVVDA